MSVFNCLPYSRKVWREDRVFSVIDFKEKSKMRLNMNSTDPSHFFFICHMLMTQKSVLYCPLLDVKYTYCGHIWIHIFFCIYTKLNLSIHFALKCQSKINKTPLLCWENVAACRAYNTYCAPAAGTLIRLQY